MTLDKLQHLWIERFQIMQENPKLDAEKLAAPFLSVMPDGYDPAKHRGILLVGKATGGEWYRSSFEEHRSVAERQKTTQYFIKDAANGGSDHRAFWRFARALDEMNSGSSTERFKNLIWSNVAKVGVLSGNPSGQYLNLQADLAVETLKAEIDTYKPTLVVFTVENYAYDLLEQVLENYGAGDQDERWVKQSDISWRPRDKNAPAFMCTNHPQGKSKQTLTK